MHKEGYYSSGEFAKITHVTKKTLRYYNDINLLTPSLVTDNKSRFYTDDDVAKMSQILLLKFIGYSLDDIKDIMINNNDVKLLTSSLRFQKKLIEEKVEQMQLVSNGISNLLGAIECNGDGVSSSINWTDMLDIISASSMEYTLKNQYLDATNINSRINLHTLYSCNKTGWWRWIYNQCRISNGQNILELGCADGTFWRENIDRLPKDISILLSDKSSGMIANAMRSFSEDERFSFDTFPCENIPHTNRFYDRVIANHVMFYCDDINKALSNICSVLSDQGIFVCSCYGPNHMKEISSLVSEFDNRIILAADNLYNRFGRENGCDMLKKHFSDVSWATYDDSLYVTSSSDLMSYILSCHGNQNQYILDRYKDFKQFITEKVGDGMHITKDAGLFICRK